MPEAIGTDLERARLVDSAGVEQGARFALSRCRRTTQKQQA
jgi:hypothetical protein